MKVNCESNAIKVNKVLPKSVCISRAGTHLYSIGLSLYKPINARNRQITNTPVFVFILLILFLLKHIILIIIPKQSQKFYTIAGDFTYFTGIRIPTSILMIDCITIALLSQLLNVYNYSRGIKPRDLRVFAMLSGLITPISVGIHDKHIVRKLITFSKKYIVLTEFATKIMCLLIWLIIFMLTAVNQSFMNIVFISFPHSIIMAVISNNFNNIFIWQLIYYSIIAFYIQLKIKSTNQLSMKYKFTQIIRKYNNIFVEIYEYNGKYWSIFLGIYWILISFSISAFIYMATFAKIIPIIRYIALVFSVEFFINLVFITHFSSQLNKQFIKSYKILNSLSIQYNKSFRVKLMVIITYHF